MSLQHAFLKYQAQTSDSPLALEVSSACGSYIYDDRGKAYLDFVAGVSACSLGHKHPAVVKAIKDQLEQHMHVMVYGEFIQKPQLKLATLLNQHLPDPLTTTYLTNSGTEAVEGALKLAKRYTGRSEIIACQNAYHGNTQGSMSVCGRESQNSAFRPLIPGVRFIKFNLEDHIDKITTDTAAVILETIQGGAGFITPENDYLKKIRQRCNTTGTLMILDEIQPGFGRTGKLFSFEHYDVIPDVVVMGKGMGGGMPVGAFTASEKLMDCLKRNPKLGHITTFGGHPVIAAACVATLEEITQSGLIPQTLEKEKLFRKKLKHPAIKELRGKGLMLALMVENETMCSEIVLRCLKKGLLLFWLLYEGSAVRITPPLTISEDEIIRGCDLLLETVDEVWRMPTAK